VEGGFEGELGDGEGGYGVERARLDMDLQSFEVCACSGSLCGLSVRIKLHEYLWRVETRVKAANEV